MHDLQQMLIAVHNACSSSVKSVMISSKMESPADTSFKICCAGVLSGRPTNYFRRMDLGLKPHDSENLETACHQPDPDVGATDRSALKD